MKEGSGSCEPAAFTLLELLVVLTLIAVMSGAAVVSMTGRDDTQELVSSAKDLAVALRYARSESRARAQPYRVVFDSNYRSYEIQRSDSDGNWASAEGLAGKRHRLQGSVRVGIGDSGINVESDLGPVAYTFGDEEGDFSGSIFLYGEDEHCLRIDVLPVTGQVTISEELQDRGSAK